MSETFRVGDNVVFRSLDGGLFDTFGMGEVIASDISTVTVRTAHEVPAEWQFNAGTLKLKPCPLPWDEPKCFVIAHPTEADIEALQDWRRMQEHDRKLTSLASILSATDPGTVSESQVAAMFAALDGRDRTCLNCAWWRPPFTVGPGNCHNQHLIALTRANDDGFPPPTPATFGCVHWESKELAEETEPND